MSTKIIISRSVGGIRITEYGWRTPRNCRTRRIRSVLIGDKCCDIVCKYTTETCCIDWIFRKTISILRDSWRYRIDACKEQILVGCRVGDRIHVARRKTRNRSIWINTSCDISSIILDTIIHYFGARNSDSFRWNRWCK